MTQYLSVQDIISGTIGLGDLVTVFKKSVLDDVGSLDLQSLIQQLVNKYGIGSTVAYMVETGKEVRAREGSLIYSKKNIQSFTLVLVTSSPYFVIESSVDEVFRVIGDRDHVVDKSGVVLTPHGVNLLKVIFDEPLDSNRTIVLTGEGEVIKVRLMGT